MRYLATLIPADPFHEMLIPLWERVWDVTPEIDALGGAIPRADSNGTDMLKHSTHAPKFIRDYCSPFRIEVTVTPEAPSAP